MTAYKKRQILSVSEVNRLARTTLEEFQIWVEGEISSLKKNPAYNFYYLSLTDNHALLPCVADGTTIDKLKGELIGQEVLAYGSLSLYEPRGQYQFRIYKIEAAGEGLLQLKLDELVRRLRSEGLFEQQYKKEIPEYPRRVCVVTSYNSDAWNDFKKHTVDKFPIIELYVADVRVQGPESVGQLLNILPMVDKDNFDAIVLTRGGGSIEDLAAFNDEQVARTIFKMNSPIIVAIGHEANESVAEWVADKRASTPTDAANFITAGYQRVTSQIDSYKQRLATKADYRIATNFQKLDYIYYQLQRMRVGFKDLPHRLIAHRQFLAKQQRYLVTVTQVKLDQIASGFKKSTKALVDRNQLKLANLQRSLFLLSPENTLKRGYSITQDQSGHILKSIDSVAVGDFIGVKLSDGRLKSVIRKKIKND